jgi:hypothetical protein
MGAFELVATRPAPVISWWGLLLLGASLAALGMRRARA